MVAAGESGRKWESGNLAPGAAVGKYDSGNLAHAGRLCTHNASHLHVEHDCCFGMFSRR